MVPIAKPTTEGMDQMFTTTDTDCYETYVTSYGYGFEVEVAYYSDGSETVDAWRFRPDDGCGFLVTAGYARSGHWPTQDHTVAPAALIQGF